MPDCSFEELIPIFSTRYSGDHLWLRPAMKRCGISRLGSQITPGEFTTHDTASLQSSHCNHLSNPSFMYCRTYVNLYDAVRSVIPCDKSHKHQFSFNNDGQQRASFGNSNTGATFLFHETGNQLRVYFGIFLDTCLGNMPPINFRVELKACFCRIKWLTSNIRHNRNNFHLTWESTFPTSAWASDGVDSFLTAGGCDDSGESDWPTATTRSKQSRYMNEESMGMARSKSRGTDSFWH